MSRARSEPPRPQEGAAAPSFVSADATEPAPWLLERILHRDGDLLVIDKPVGLAVHPGPRTPESLEAYLPSLLFGRRDPPQPVHRLDRDTSGCLVLGRTRAAIKRLTGLFATGQVKKTYWAIVTGSPPSADGVIAQSLAKRNDRSGWRMVADPKGLSAVTRYRVLASSGGTSLLELLPQTGRTHQIRIHCALLGCPVMDDPIYGGGDATKPHRLHARRIVIPARDGGDIDVTAPLPAETAGILRNRGITVWESAEIK